MIINNGEPSQLALDVIVRRILEQQLEYDQMAKKFREVNGDDSLEIDIALYEIASDMYGVPQDNTVEIWEGKCAPCFEYCRDWIMEAWDQVVEGICDIDWFMLELRNEAMKYILIPIVPVE